MPFLVEIASDQTHWVGSCGPLVVLFWKEGVAPEVCLRLPELAHGLARRQSDGRVGVLSVTSPAAPAPSGEARKALVRLVRDTQSTVSRFAIVREGQGFVASVAASIVTGIQMLAEPGSPHKIFLRLEEGIRWVTVGLGEFAAAPDRIEEVVAAVQEQRRKLV